MEVINITEEQKNNLCQELAKLVFEFKKNNGVECIYFIPFKEFGKIRDNVLEVTLVMQSVNDTDVNTDITKRNRFYLEEESLKKFGVKIFVDTDIAHKYTVIDLNPSEVKRSNSLFNSTILFDRYGKYTELKGQKKQDGVIIFHYKNLAEIVPPITNETYKSMEIIQMETDTEIPCDSEKSKPGQGKKFYPELWKTIEINLNAQPNISQTEYGWLANPAKGKPTTDEEEPETCYEKQLKLVRSKSQQ